MDKIEYLSNDVESSYQYLTGSRECWGSNLSGESWDDIKKIVVDCSIRQYLLSEANLLEVLVEGVPRCVADDGSVSNPWGCVEDAKTWLEDYESSKSLQKAAMYLYLGYSEAVDIADARSEGLRFLNDLGQHVMRVIASC